MEEATLSFITIIHLPELNLRNNFDLEYCKTNTMHNVEKNVGK